MDREKSSSINNPLSDEVLKDVYGGIFGGVYASCGHLIVTPYHSCNSWKPGSNADPKKIEMYCWNCENKFNSGILMLCSAVKR